MGRHLRATSCVQVEARCELRFKKYHLKTRRCRAQPISACAFLPTSNDAHSARGLGHPAGVMLGSETPWSSPVARLGVSPRAVWGNKMVPLSLVKLSTARNPPPHTVQGQVPWASGQGEGHAQDLDWPPTWIRTCWGPAPSVTMSPQGPSLVQGCGAPARSLPRTLAQKAGPGRQGPAQLRGLRLASSLVAGSRLGCGLTPHIRGPPFITARGQVHLWQEQHREHEEMHLAS